MKACNVDEIIVPCCVNTRGLSTFVCKYVKAQIRKSNENYQVNEQREREKRGEDGTHEVSVKECSHGETREFTLDTVGRSLATHSLVHG